MRATRIEGADPTPVGAPPNWRPDENGHCTALFVRRVVEGGIHFQQSAWEPDHHEAMCMLAGGKAVLGVSANRHPVVNLGVVAPPEDAEPVYASRRVISVTGGVSARVDAFYPHGGGRRCFCEVPMDGGDPFATCVAVAIRHCDAFAGREGWLAAQVARR